MSLFNILKVIYKTVNQWIRKPRDLVFCKWHGLGWDSSWIFWGLPLVSQRRRGSINAGRQLTLCSSPKYNSIGVFQKVVLKALTPEARIEIGENVGMSGCTISARSLVTIGDDVLIGSGALISDSDAHPVHPDHRFDNSKLEALPVIIGSRTFIGARAIILKGVSIGEGAVVGAGAVVSRSVEPYAIVAGNPAKLIGDSRGKKAES